MADYYRDANGKLHKGSAPKDRPAQEYMKWQQENKSKLDADYQAFLRAQQSVDNAKKKKEVATKLDQTKKVQNVLNTAATKSNGSPEAQQVIQAAATEVGKDVAELSRQNAQNDYNTRQKYIQLLNEAHKAVTGKPFPQTPWYAKALDYAKSNPSEMAGYGVATLGGGLLGAAISSKKDSFAVKLAKHALAIAAANAGNYALFHTDAGKSIRDKVSGLGAKK